MRPLPRKIQTGHLALLVISLCYVVGYWQTLSALGVEWSGNGAYSHGFLAVLIILYMLWQNRTLISRVNGRLPIFATIIVACAGTGWMLVTMISVQKAQVLFWYISLIGVFAVLYGYATVYRLKIPLLCLFLVLPIWDFLQPVLQLISADVTEIGLSVAGIPLFRESFRFSVPGGQFIIEEACSGLGFFLTSALLGVLFAYYNRLSGVRALTFIVFALGLAMFSNWVRIITIMIIGNYSQMQHIIVQDHLTFGWIVFSLSLIPLFVIGHWITPRTSPPLTSPTDYSVQKKTPIFVASIILIAFPVLNLALSSAPSGESSSSWIIGDIESLVVSEGRKSLWSPTFIGASDVHIGAHQYHGTDIDSLVVRYDQQQQGKELIFVKNELYSRERWSKQERNVLHHPISDFDSQQALHTVRNRAGVIRHISFWYIVGGSITTNSIEAKVLELKGKVTGVDVGYLVAFSMSETAPTDRRTLLDVSGEIQKRITSALEASGGQIQLASSTDLL